MDDADPQYEEFHRKWADRLGLKGRHITLGYLRGQALGPESDEGLEAEGNETGIHIRVDGVGLDGAVEPNGIDALVEEWRTQLETQDVEDPRTFTKDFITQTIALNRHLDEEYGPMALCGAVWLISDNPAGMEALREGGRALLCEITFDDGTKKRRLQMSILSESAKPIDG
ncbi:hypothetical protein [Methylobacterium sp. A54F]